MRASKRMVPFLCRTTACSFPKQSSMARARRPALTLLKDFSTSTHDMTRNRGFFGLFSSRRKKLFKSTVSHRLFLAEEGKGFVLGPIRLKQIRLRAPHPPWSPTRGHPTGVPGLTRRYSRGMSQRCTAVDPPLTLEFSARPSPSRLIGSGLAPDRPSRRVRGQSECIDTYKECSPKIRRRTP